jgi:hypothetical protein
MQPATMTSDQPTPAPTPLVLGVAAHMLHVEVQNATHKTYTTHLDLLHPAWPQHMQQPHQCPAQQAAVGHPPPKPAEPCNVIGKSCNGCRCELVLELEGMYK